ncbi:MULTISPECIES: hypothetical protein [Haloarcula]|uniref:hypothetical protein n=1 Tax=Haloarcula TaxID=2237 RepID=UPI0023EC5D6C|nr:hypothetical protein [Halomicroarcula sp. XH51]
MRQEIEQLSSAELDNSTDSLALIFASKYTPTPIRLHEPKTEDVGQVKKTIERLGPSRNLPGGGKVTKKVQRLKLKVPYSGEKHLLLKRPKRTTHPLPTYDELTQSQIVYNVDYEVKGKDADEIKKTIDSEISKWEERLEREVEHLNRDIRKMQEDFENRARRHIETHRENMEAKEEALDELGISTESVDEGFVEPEKKKDLELPDLEGEAEQRQRIRDRTFVDILDIINGMRVNIERSKNRLRELDEESLRDIFLGAIDSHYGSATGESFNRGGKTDILLRHDSVNLFIAECKFWQGKSHFQDAVDQLLGNLTVDDGHAALLVFSNRGDVVQVRNRIEEAIEAHENFETDLTRFEDHEVYRFQAPSGSEVKVAVKVVDLGA